MPPYEPYGIMTAFLHVSFMQFASVRFLSKLQDDELYQFVQ